VLSPENHSEFKIRIPIESLSKVAQDAITVCRALSVRYLWIDAICIMQGPDGDFHQEAARMEDVYANALFTINAAASTDTTQPFLVRRNPLWWIDCQLMADDDGKYENYVEGNYYCKEDDHVPGMFPLDFRGWCFQEQFLSPRSIYFGARGIHWECRESIVCERHSDMEIGHEVSGPMDSSRKALYTKLVSLNDNLSDPTTVFVLRELWRKIVRGYTATQLTHRSDKLLALAGVASMIEDKFNMRASFGLWLEMFLDELLWFRYGKMGQRRVRLDIAPSWSWVNMDDCDTITVAETLHGGEKRCRQRLLDSLSATIVSLPSVTGFTSCLWVPSAESKAPVRIRGRLTPCVCRTVKSRHPDLLFERLDPKDCPSPSDCDIGRYIPDSDLEETDIYCFLVRREYREVLYDENRTRRGRWISDQCLVLASVSKPEHRFRRIGIYHEEIKVTQDHQTGTNESRLLIDSHMFADEGGGQEVEIEII
jgi:hypothetical protein